MPPLVLHVYAGYNAIIYYLNGDAAGIEVIRPVLSGDVSLYISAIIELELFGYPQLTDDEAERLEELLRSMVIILVDSRIARIAGTVCRQYRLKTADSAIAGTALLTHTT